MSKLLVVAPHPDDETLGCGGTLLKARNQSASLNWLIVTTIDGVEGYAAEQVRSREAEIEQVSKAYGFDSVFKLEYPTCRLDSVPAQELVDSIGKVIKEIEADTLYLPYPGDAHSDHKIVFDAACSCTKWFRYPSVRRVLAYETISETEFGLRLEYPVFNPNVFVDIQQYAEKKLEIINIYQSEMDKFPFPRSEEVIAAQMKLRGSAAGCRAAEAFMLIKETS